MVDLPLIHKDTAFLGDVEAKQTGVSGGAGKRRSCIRLRNPYPVPTTIHTHLGKQWICGCVGVSPVGDGEGHKGGMSEGLQDEGLQIGQLESI